MKSKVMFFLATVVLSASVLLAQGPGPRNGGPPNPANFVQRRVEHLTTLLNLTSDQQTKATQIFTDAITGFTTVGAQIKTARQTLQADIKATAPGAAVNTAKIKADGDALGSLEAQVIYNNSVAEAQFLSILTVDQQNKFSELNQHGPFGGGGGFGPGGPGGPGQNGFRRGR